jgi:hypothetical protein
MIIVPALRRDFPNDNQKGWDFHPNLSTVILSVTLMLRTSPVLFESGIRIQLARSLPVQRQKLSGSDWYFGIEALSIGLWCHWTNANLFTIDGGFSTSEWSTVFNKIRGEV